MRVLILCMVFVLTAVLATSALAVPPGKTSEYEGGGAGKVVFEGKIHANQGLKCNACHPKIFSMKKGAAKFSMTDMNAGKYCGECHNGKTAFKTADMGNCTRCHKK